MIAAWKLRPGLAPQAIRRPCRPLVLEDSNAIWSMNSSTAFSTRGAEPSQCLPPRSVFGCSRMCVEALRRSRPLVPGDYMSQANKARSSNGLEGVVAARLFACCRVVEVERQGEGRHAFCLWRSGGHTDLPLVASLTYLSTCTGTLVGCRYLPNCPTPVGAESPPEVAICIPTSFPLDPCYSRGTPFSRR